jgi:hypothetical protein
MKLIHLPAVRAAGLAVTVRVEAQATVELVLAVTDFLALRSG